MRQLLLTILFIIAAICHAADFGDISIERLPSLYDGTALRDQYFSTTYRVTNNGLQPAAVTIRETGIFYDSSVCTRSLEVAPKTTAHLTLYAPPCLNSHKISYVVTCNIAINGKNVKLPADLANYSAPGGYHSLEKQVLLSPSLPQADLDDFLFSFINTRISPKINHTTAAISVVQWPTHVREYINYGSIWIASTDKIKPEVRQALDDYVRLGGMLVVIVPEEAPWPLQNSSEPPLWHERYLGFGRIATIRPFSSQNKAFRSAIMQKINASSDMNHRVSILEREAVFHKIPQLQKLHDLLMSFSTNEKRFIPDNLMQITESELPMFALLMVMAVFAVIIGPLNYWYLHRKDKQLLLVFTTPVISIVFCIIVFLFITFREGWKSHGSAVGFTLLDQQEHQATTFARVVMNAAFRPSGGFRFSPDELLSFNQSSDNLEVLDEPGQVIAPSIMLTRVPLDYNIRKTEPRREQLEITFNDDNTATVVNGLGAEITELLINSPDGVFTFSLHKLTPLPPGGTVTLTGNKQNTIFHSNNAKFRLPFIIQPEQIIQYLLSQSIGNWIPTGYYFAKVKEPLFHSLGMTPDTLDATHVVIGRF